MPPAVRSSTSIRTRCAPTSRAARLLPPHSLVVEYRVTEQLDEAADQAAVELLSFEERERYARFVRPADRRDFAAAHALLRRTLSTHADIAPTEWAFRANAAGKPEVDPVQAGNPPLAFSLSHARGRVACAVARGVDLGVDVESVERAVDDQEVARRFFSNDEQRQLNSCAEGDRRARFIDLWTLKEAYVKALGTGLSLGLDRFSFSLDEEIRLVHAERTPGARWMFALFAPSPDARMAIAVRSGAALDAEIVARDASGSPLVPVLTSVEE